MLQTLAVAVGYAKAPRTTFMLRHPRQALTTMAVVRGLRESRTARRVVGGLVGLGAVSVAIPVAAVMLLRR
jgi:hypothetical protein